MLEQARNTKESHFTDADSDEMGEPEDLGADWVTSDIGGTGGSVSGGGRGNNQRNQKGKWNSKFKKKEAGKTKTTHESMFQG